MEEQIKSDTSKSFLGLVVRLNHQLRDQVPKGHRLD